LTWKVDIHTFLEIHNRPVNSHKQGTTICLKSGLKSAKNVRKLKKHCFLIYYGF
jgi:hypothetical protein